MFSQDEWNHLDDIDNLTSSDVLHVYDVFTLKEMEELFSKKGTPGLIVTDHIVRYDEFSNHVNFLGLPLYFALSLGWHNKADFVDNLPVTNYCFNFMINKKQVNRHLCIQLVKALELTSFIYTWSGQDSSFDCTDIINEHNSLGESSPFSADTFGTILSPIQIKPRFYTSKEIESTSGLVRSGRRSLGGSTDTSKPWKWGMHELFCESAVSLITESLEYQKASAYTEKSVYPLLGLGFPIWIGGYNQADEWQALGFDTFSDVIDHSYQYYDTLLERCYYAFAKNEKMLTDLDYARSVRNSCIDRLYANRQLALSDHLHKHIKKQLESVCSTDTTSAFNTFLDFYGISHF